MAYLFKVPNRMRVFKAVSRGSAQLYDARLGVRKDDILEVTTAKKVSYNHATKLGLRLNEGEPNEELYLLIEEVDVEDCRELAYRWTSLYEDFVMASSKEMRMSALEDMQRVFQKLVAILSRLMERAPGASETDDIATFADDPSKSSLLPPWSEKS